MYQFYVDLFKKKKLKALFLKGAEYFNLECVKAFNAYVNIGRRLKNTEKWVEQGKRRRSKKTKQ